MFDFEKVRSNSWPLLMRKGWGKEEREELRQKVAVLFVPCYISLCWGVVELTALLHQSLLERCGADSPVVPSLLERCGADSPPVATSTEALLIWQSCCTSPCSSVMELTVLLHQSLLERCGADSPATPVPVGALWSWQSCYTSPCWSVVELTVLLHQSLLERCGAHILAVPIPVGALWSWQSCYTSPCWSVVELTYLLYQSLLKRCGADSPATPVPVGALWSWQSCYTSPCWSVMELTALLYQPPLECCGADSPVATSPCLSAVNLTVLRYQSLCERFGADSPCWSVVEVTYLLYQSLLQRCGADSPAAPVPVGALWSRQSCCIKLQARWERKKQRSSTPSVPPYLPSLHSGLERRWGGTKQGCQLEFSRCPTWNFIVSRAEGYGDGGELQMIPNVSHTRRKVLALPQIIGVGAMTKSGRVSNNHS